MHKNPNLIAETNRINPQVLKAVQNIFNNVYFTLCYSDGYSVNVNLSLKPRTGQGTGKLKRGSAFDRK